MATSIAKSGIDTKNLIDSRKSDKQNQRNIKAKFLNNLSNQRNLLEEQLASRRAKVGAMGISSDGSATAIQQGQLQDFHRQSLMDAIETAGELKQKKLQSRTKSTTKTNAILNNIKQIK